MILAGDHYIYKMNYARMIDYHRDQSSRPDDRLLAGAASAVGK